MEARKRRKANDTPGAAHALTFSSYRRQPVLLVPGVAETFLRHLDRARHDLDFALWAYVVMPEHVHIVLRPRQEAYSMARILKAVKAEAAKEILRGHPSLRDRLQVPRSDGKEECRLWQAGGGYDRNLYRAKAAWAEIRYVHWNPVRRGLCELPWLWTFSSAGAYSEDPHPTPIPVDVCPWE